MNLQIPLKLFEGIYEKERSSLKLWFETRRSFVVD